ARAAELGVFAFVREVGAVAADAGGDRLAGFRMRADRAREAQELQRPVEIEIGQIARDRGALRLLALAELDVRPEAADAARDSEARRGILAHRAVLVLAVLARLAEAAGIGAFGIVRAADERPVAAALERQPP